MEKMTFTPNGTARQRFIHLDKPGREFIMKAFKVGPKTVANALYFSKEKGFSDTSERIRRLALERGGVVMNVVPECETIFEANGVMRQTFQNGALVEADKNTGEVDVWFKGEKVRHEENVLLTLLDEIQLWAAELK